MSIPIDLGTTGVSVDVQILDDNGLPVEGLLASTFPAIYWSTANAANTAFPALSDLASINGAWAAGGVKERGGGYYRLDLPNAFGQTLGAKTIQGEETNKRLLVEKVVTVEGTVLARADQYIDKGVTPWCIVYMKEGTGGIGVGQELMRKRLANVDGNDLTSTNTVVGQAKQ